MVKMLYPDEQPQVHRHSSIDQFSGVFSVYKQGGWAPIVFDQLDGITCETIRSHPVVISFSNDIGYVFPEAHCSYTSEKYLYFDKEGVEQRLLPAIFGGDGEFYEAYLNQNSFVNFDNDTSLGVRNKKRLRIGLDYVLADKTLPASE